MYGVVKGCMVIYRGVWEYIGRMGMYRDVWCCIGVYGDV